MKQIFLIIVHFGSVEPTSRLLDALSAITTPWLHRILVNHDPTPWRGDYGPVHVVNKPNRGYFAGFAEGVSAARLLGAKKDDIIMCLNNDVLLSPQDIYQIYSWLRDKAGDFLAGAQFGWVAYVSGRARIGNRRTLFGFPYVHGPVIAAPLETLLRIGIPSEMGMYWEDVVISLYARKAEVPMYSIPLPRGIHDDTAKMSDAKLYYLVRNGAAVLEHAPSPPWRVIWRVRNILRLAYHRFEGHAFLAKALADRKNVHL